MFIQPFKLLLVITNFSIVAYLVVLIFDHYKYHYDIRSFSSAFHILCFAWLSIKGLFWLSTLTTLFDWTAGNYYFLYWMPVPLEFGSFLLLPLYFAQILYPTEWRDYWKSLRPLYAVIIISLMSFQTIYILMEVYNEVN